MQRVTVSPSPIYADYNASTPVDPRVLAVVRDWLTGPPANPGSVTHRYGQDAQAAVEWSRAEIAASLRAEPEEVVFTSGATESNNLALLGISSFGLRHERRHILASAIEHPSVLVPLEQLRRRGFEVEFVPVTGEGVVEVDQLLPRLRRDTLLVSVMHANNETGVLQPIREIGEALRKRGIFFHTDASQSFGKEPELLQDVTYDFLSLSGHKIYGPPGIGALLARRPESGRGPLEPLLWGGGQERGLRAGTLPTALIVGLGVAVQVARQDYLARRTAAQQVKQTLLAALQGIDHVVHGAPEQTQSHVLHVSFPGVDSAALIAALRDELAISTGSACSSARHQPSHVLEAMGVPPAQLTSAIRLSWGPGVTEIPTQGLLAAVQRFRSAKNPSPH